MTAPDLTAQRAASVREAWGVRHMQECDCALVGYPCRYPKPSALVAYEQGQAVTPVENQRAWEAAQTSAQTSERFPGNDLSRLPCKCPAKRGEACPFTAEQCRLRNPDCTCQDCIDLCADGAGESLQPRVFTCGCTEGRDDCSSPDHGKGYRAEPRRVSDREFDTITTSEPALAYVLTRGRMPVRCYASRARAEQDLALVVMEGSSEPDYYRVHAVSRVD